MKRFVEGEDWRQGVLLPEYLDDFVAEENQVRVIEALVEELDLASARNFNRIRSEIHLHLDLWREWPAKPDNSALPRSTAID